MNRKSKLVGWLALGLAAVGGGYAISISIPLAPQAVPTTIGDEASLYEMNLTDEGLLRHIDKNVRRYFLHGNPKLTAASVGQLPITTITSLNIASTGVGTDIAACWKATPTLENLDCNHTALDAPSVAKLFPALRLQSLNVSYSRHDGTGLCAANTPALEELYLAGVSLAPGTLKSISELRSLRRLSLRGAVFDSSELLLLAEHPTLEFIDVSETRVTAADLAAVLGAPNLQRVWAQDCPQLSAGAEAWAFGKPMEILNVVGSAIDSEMVSGWEQQFPWVKVRN